MKIIKRKMKFFSKDNYNYDEINWNLLEEEDKDYEIEMDVGLEQNEEFEDRHPLFYFELFLDEEFY